MINTSKFPVTHEDRHLACQEEVDGALQMILDRAATHGWGTMETISAMEEVLKSLRVAHAGDAHPAEDSGEGDVDTGSSGDFPSTDELVEALDKGRGVP